MKTQWLITSVYLHVYRSVGWQGLAGLSRVTVLHAVGWFRTVPHVLIQGPRLTGQWYPWYRLLMAAHWNA